MLCGGASARGSRCCGARGDRFSSKFRRNCLLRCENLCVGLVTCLFRIEISRRKQPTMELLMLAMWFLALPIAALSPSMEGFISIDCGYEGKSNYTDKGSTILYSPDDLYIDSGTNAKVSQETDVDRFHHYYKTLRSFPNGTRNCYTLKPVQRGRKYLVRGEFMYGNFDGQNSPPFFDLYLGIYFWDSVPSTNFTRLEIIAVSPGDSIQVCLVNRDSGTPYITALDLRPLQNSMYPLVNSSHALTLRVDRTNYGMQSGSLRYSSDPFDRIWFASRNDQNWLRVNTTQTIKDMDSKYGIPAPVLSSAVTMRKTSESLEFNLTANQGENTYFIMHFAEIEQLKNDELREFDLYANDSLLFAQFKPSYLSLGTLYANSSGNGGTTTYSLKPTKKSTLPPIINAMETHTLRELRGLPTDENDVNAIIKIKEVYKMKSWQGDPCVPMEFSWKGLNCSYIGSLNPRITSLNLSHRKLEGGISPYIANLTALVSLDLSCNNLTGEIPSGLELLKELKVLDLSCNNLTGEIPSGLELLKELKVLNLSHNQLRGQVPYILLDKAGNKTLSISVAGNKHLCARIDSCKPNRKKNRIIIPIAISMSIFLLLCLAAMIVWRIRRRQKYRQASRKIEQNLYSESSRFTYEEIVHMTKNFQQQIGRGSCGIVYHGHLKIGSEVAIKMISKTSIQEAKLFEAEAQILTSVLHQNLVSLIGYCSDPDNLALVYEFVVHGNLARHLSDKSAGDLSWKIRLKIALDVAQGLNHLHSFFKPPLIHRAVKTSNILLNQNLEAKLADFGLSRLLQDDSSSPISKSIVGTPGYLDPEFYHTSVLNEKSDVYSFGIVLLELITGKPPIMDGVEKTSIVSWVKSRAEKGDLTEILDPRVQGNFNPNSIWKAIDVAILCTDSPAIQRPSMSDVVVELKESLASLSLQAISRNNESQEQCLVDAFPDEIPLAR